MNKLSKFFLFIISILGVVLMGLLGLNLAAMYDFLPFDFPVFISSTYLENNNYIGYVILGVIVVLFVVFLLLFLMTLFTRTTVKQLRIKSDNGELFITKDAIENGIRYSVSDLPECRNANVSIKLFKRNANVIVHFENELTNLALTQDLEVAIRERVNKVILEMTGKDAKRITIKFSESKNQKKALKNHRVI